MKSLIRVASLALIGSLSVCSAFAAGFSEDVRIVEMSLSKSYGNFVFVRLNAAPQTPASCSVNGYWNFTISLDDTIGKNMYAQLLTAYATSSLVNIIGAGACNEFGAVESMAGMRLRGL